MDEISRMIHEATCYTYLDDYAKARNILEDAYEIAVEVLKTKIHPEIARLYLKMIKVYSRLNDEDHVIEFMQYITKCNIEEQPEINAELIEFLTDCEFQNGYIEKEVEFQELNAVYNQYKENGIVGVHCVTMAVHYFLSAIRNREVEGAEEAEAYIRSMILKVVFPETTTLEKSAKKQIDKYFEEVLEEVCREKDEHESMFGDEYEDIGEL